MESGYSQKADIFKAASGFGCCSWEGGDGNPKQPLSKSYRDMRARWGIGTMDFRQDFLSLIHAVAGGVQSMELPYSAGLLGNLFL